MTTINAAQQPSQRIPTLCRDILSCKLWASAAYGARANIYRPSSVADMELSSPQHLLLALLHSLVTGDIKYCIVIADICHKVEKLRSRHYKVWLQEEFDFPRPDIQKAVVLLIQLVVDGTLKLPPHLLGIMAAVANKYGDNGVHLRTLTEEGRCDLAIKLEKAVVENNPRDIFDLASEGADVRGSTQDGDSLLHLAAKTGSCACIAVLGILKADLEVLNSYDATPLEEAVRDNCAPSIKALLMAGAEIGKRIFRGNTYLHIAAQFGHIEAIEALLEGGIEVNGKDDLGETPIIIAARNSKVDILTLLLMNGADTNIKDKKGRTPLHYAAKRGCVESVSRLLVAGALVNEKDNKGETPAIVAAVNKKLNVLQLLIEKGADLHSKDSDEDGILHHAAGNGYVQVVKRLLDSGVPVDLKDKYKRTTLHFAAWGGHVEVVAELLDKGAALDMKTREQHTALHFSAQKGHTAVVKVLLNHGADTADTSLIGHTPLTLASLNGHLAVVELLIDRGSPLNVRAEGRTAVGWAYYNNHRAVADYLRSRGGVE